VKMIIAEWYHIPTALSLGVIGLILALSIFASLRYGQDDPHGDPNGRSDDHLEPLTGAEDDADLEEAVHDAVDADPTTHPGISGDRR